MFKSSLITKTVLQVMLLCFTCVIHVKSQNSVSIGTEEINSNAVLQLVSKENNQGFLAPQLSTSNRLAMNLQNSDNGMLVFDNELGEFFYWHNGLWNEISNREGDFSNGGEAGGADRTLGNTDNYGLGLKTNNNTRLLVDNTGNIGIGTTDPGGLLGLKNTNTWLDVDDSNNLIFTDAVTGTMTLAELAAGSDFWNPASNGIYYIGNVGIGFTEPLSRLHIGIPVDDNPVDIGGGWREWMNNGLSVSWETDNLFFGLKDEGGDKKNGIIAWGDNEFDDILRFMFINMDGSEKEILTLTSENVGINTTEPSSKLDVNGSTGFNQFRLRTSYTPSETSDTNGNIGDISWDDDYVYVKTNAGWKRSALSTW